MKEVCELSSEGPVDIATSEDPSTLPEWASLLPELVEEIAGHVLSTTVCVDVYMNMRAVCSSWRVAITKPSPLAAVADLRFRPRHWVMEDKDPRGEDYEDDWGHMFLHVPTGRIRRLFLSFYGHNFLFNTTDGLLVLGEREPPHLAHVLNPFTGDMLHFVAPLPKNYLRNLAYTSVNGGSIFMLVLLAEGTVFYAGPTSDEFTEKGTGTFLNSIVDFQGNVYCADDGGCVFKFVASADQCDVEFVVVAQMSSALEVSSRRSFLVESAGELLLVRCYLDETFKVFKVNVERKLLEEVNSLCGRMLFLGDERCLSVETDNFPSSYGDCIYMMGLEYDTCDMCVYNLRGAVVDRFSEENYSLRPFSLVQVLLQYCHFHYDV